MPAWMPDMTARVWVCLQGGTRYARALWLGDVAPAQAAHERAAQCRACEAARVSRLLAIAKGRGRVTCGPVGDEQLDGPVGERRCGCIVGEVPRELMPPKDRGTAEERRDIALAVMQPAAKLWVASESCPRGKWGPVERVPAEELSWLSGRGCGGGACCGGGCERPAGQGD